MNLALHFGWLGALEAGLIAFAIGLLAFALFQAIARRARWSHGHAVGWACLAAVAVGAGIDAWHLFYLGAVRLESPVYARVVLARIHDADSLGLRVLLEVVGALAGVALGWVLAERRAR